MPPGPPALRRCPTADWRLGLALAFQWFALLFTPTATLPCAAAPAPPTLPNYASWRAACQRLPFNRALGGSLPPRELLPLRTFADFAAVLDPFLEQCRTGELARAEAWVAPAPRTETFFNLSTAYFLQPTTPFQPFAQRHEVPPGTRVLLHGDLHGDIHALIAYLDELQRLGYLDGFRVSRPDIRLVFLGDYTDRGRYGIEVLYSLLRLRLENPRQVLLVRGNHEDVSLTARYGFLAEAQGKYGRAYDAARVGRLYDFLPAVLYLVSGTNVAQCNHGGLEPGFDPRRLLAEPGSVSFQLLGKLEQRRLLATQADWVSGLAPAVRRDLEANLVDFLPESPTTPTVLGFMWNDFTVLRGEPQFAIDPGRAFVYGDEAARVILAQGRGAGHRIRTLFRAHQHAAALNPLMRRLIASRGLFRHWQDNDNPAMLEGTPEKLRGTLDVATERNLPDGSVWTFNVSPDSVYGMGCGFTFDTAGELLVAERWEDWRLRVINLEIPTR